MLASVDLEIYILLGQFANLTRLCAQTTDAPNQDHSPKSESEAPVPPRLRQHCNGGILVYCQP